MTIDRQPPEQFITDTSRNTITARLSTILPTGELSKLLDQAEAALLEYWVSSFLNDHQLPKRPGAPVAKAIRAASMLTDAIEGMSPLVAKRFMRHLGIEVAGDRNPFTREESGGQTYVNCLRPIVVALRFTQGRTRAIRNDVAARAYTQLLLDLACIWPWPFQWKKYSSTHNITKALGGSAFICEVLEQAARQSHLTDHCMSSLKIPDEPTMRSVLKRRPRSVGRDRSSEHSGGRTRAVKKSALKKLGDDIWR